MLDREYISYPEPILSVTFLVRSGRFRFLAANAGGTTSMTVNHVSSIPCRRLSVCRGECQQDYIESRVRVPSAASNAAVAQSVEQMSC